MFMTPKRILRRRMAIGGGDLHVRAGGCLRILGDARRSDARPLIVGDPDHGVDADPQAILVLLVGVVEVGDARIIGIGGGVIPWHTPPQAVHVAQIPVGHDVAVIRGLAEEAQGAVVVAVLVGALSLLQVVGPEGNVDFGEMELRGSGKIGVELGNEARVLGTGWTGLR